jgi:LasA protease
LSKRTILHRFTPLLLLFWLVPALACNYPVSDTGGSIAQEQARETTVAQLVATAWEEQHRPAEPLPTPPIPSPVETPAASPTPALPIIEATAIPPGGIPADLASDPHYFYYTVQPGDTLEGVAGRFDVDATQISSDEWIGTGSLLLPGQMLVIPNLLDAFYPLPVLFPDSEVVFSPTSADFSIDGFIYASAGYLSSYSETVDEEVLSGAEIVRRVAYDTSTNPRLLLALLEYRAGWVRGQPINQEAETYPLGFYVPEYTGLYKELALAAKQLNTAYYAWRSGSLTQLRFPNGGSLRLDPQSNAGSVAVQYVFARFFSQSLWEEALYGERSFNAVYEQMFGDPWTRAAQGGDIFPAGLAQPPLELPFLPGERWALTGGPHITWNTGTPRGAIDFAPVTGEPRCAVSRAWVTASASGMVARSERSVVVIDLDGDGLEQTGWALVFLHVAESERVPPGVWVDLDDPIGHPSCEGGTSTGSHVHLARKYNGEWLPAIGMVPFILSGWEVQAGEWAYEGYLVKGDQVVSARPDGSRSSSIVR